MVKQAARNATKKKGAAKKKKTITKAKQKKEQDHHHASSSASLPSIRSKFVGVSWFMRDKKWKAQITIDGKTKNLGLFDNEKEAACKYDEQAALLNKPVNFPQHEGQEQAVKRAPKGSAATYERDQKYCKSHAKKSNHEDGTTEDEWEDDDDDDDDDDDESVHSEEQPLSSPTFLQHLVHQQATLSLIHI